VEFKLADQESIHTPNQLLKDKEVVNAELIPMLLSSIA
jgi:hypothetical protein